MEYIKSSQHNLVLANYTGGDPWRKSDYPSKAVLKVVSLQEILYNNVFSRSLFNIFRSSCVASLRRPMIFRR